MVDHVATWETLSADERRVLEAIANTDDFEWVAYTFKGLSRATGLSIDAVRDACRSLRSKGLSRPEKGLMTEDGDFVGSGYTATSEGSNLFWNAKWEAPTQEPSP